MKAVSIIRNRGQLTIPDAIRKKVSWVSPSSAVTLSVVKADEIVIKPHRVYGEEKNIWTLVKQARAIKGKGQESAVQFLEKDRRSH